MRKSLLSIILIFFFFSCQAKDIILTLEGQKLSIIPMGYYIKDVILSQREDSCLGFLHPHGPNNCIPIFFEKSIKAEVKEFLMHSINRQSDQQPLIIRVNRIFMYQTSEGVRDYTCFDLSLSFIRQVDQTLIEDFTSAISTSVPQDFFPKYLDKILINGFDSSMNQYNKRKSMGLIVPETITSDQLKKNPLTEPGTFKHLTGKRPRKGLYRNYFDFRDNIPDTTLDFKISYDYNKNSPLLSKAYLKFPDGSKPGKFWGFCVGDSIFINGGRSFSLLSKEGDFFVNYGRSLEYEREIISAAIFGGVLFGIVGASVFGGLTAATSDPAMIDKFRLDLFNGKLLPYNAQDYTCISSNLIIFLSKVSDPNASVNVFINGQFVCDMKPGNYCSIDLSCHYINAMIKFVSSSGGELSKEVPLKLFKTYPYLLKVKKNHSITFSLLFDQMKTDILKGRTNENTICRVEL